MNQVFISYAFQDEQARAFAGFLQEHLPAFGADVIDTFMDTTLPVGEDWHTSLTEAINRCSVFVAFMSEMNPNVMFELGYALGKNKEIILVGDSQSIPADLQNMIYIHRDSPPYDILVQVQKCLSTQGKRRPYLSLNPESLRQTLINLVQHPELLDSLEGHEFEELIQDWFLMKGYKVNYPRANHDTGFDFLVEPFRGKCAAVEVKKYRTTSMIPVSTVRQLLRSMAIKHIPLGIVISSVPFAKSALFFARESDATILLWTLQDLIKMTELPNDLVDTYFSSVFEGEIYSLFSSKYRELRTPGDREVDSRTLNLLKNMLLDLTSSSKDVRWLDVGCGNGRCLKVLDAIQNRKSIKYHGIDISHEYLDNAKELAQFYDLEDSKFGRMNIAAMKFNSEYDIISSIFLFHEVDPLQLPFVLKSMLQVLKENGSIVISDIQESYESERDVIIWTAKDIENLLERICKEPKIAIETFEAGNSPENYRIYQVLIKKSNIDQIAFEEFMQRYDEFLKAKCVDLKQERDTLKGQIRDRICTILDRTDFGIKNVSEEEMNKIKCEIEDVYGVKAFQANLLTSQIDFLQRKIGEFRNRGI